MENLRIISLMVLICAGMGFTQGNGPGNQGQKRQGLDDIMGNMSSENKQKISKALQLAKEVEAEIQTAVESGASEEEINQTMNQTRTQARERLNQAIEDLQNVSDENKALLQKTMEQVQKRLEERKEEFNEAVKNRKRNGGN